jgi:hypothetical protein
MLRMLPVDATGRRFWPVHRVTAWQVVKPSCNGQASRARHPTATACVEKKTSMAVSLPAHDSRYTPFHLILIVDGRNDEETQKPIQPPMTLGFLFESVSWSF